MFIIRRKQLTEIIIVFTFLASLYLFAYFLIFSFQKDGFIPTLVTNVLLLVEAKTQSYHRKTSVKAFLPFIHIFTLPFITLWFLSIDAKFFLFTASIFSFVQLLKICTTCFYLKDDFVFVLTAPTSLKYGLPFHHYIFNDKLDWEYFFKRNINPEIIQLLHQSIQYHEDKGQHASIKLKKNLFNYNLHLNINHQIEK